jgi:hypothetical protein
VVTGVELREDLFGGRAVSLGHVTC